MIDWPSSTESKNQSPVIFKKLHYQPTRLGEACSPKQTSCWGIPTVRKVIRSTGQGGFWIVSWVIHRETRLRMFRSWMRKLQSLKSFRSNSSLKITENANPAIGAIETSTHGEFHSRVSTRLDNTSSLSQTSPKSRASPNSSRRVPGYPMALR